MAIFQDNPGKLVPECLHSGFQNVSILDFMVAKDDGGGGDNWSYKTCKTPVKSSPSPKQHPAFILQLLYTGQMSFLIYTNSVSQSI